MKQIKNAKIASTMLGYEDHGILTFRLVLDYEGSGQAFGMYALDTPVKDFNGKFIRREGTAWGMEAIAKILKCLEVDSWEKLEREHIRVEASHKKVYRIGHLLKDKWVDLEETNQ